MFESRAEFTSTFIVPASPSSLQTANPVMGQPPFQAGACQARVKEVQVDVTRVGFGIPEGDTQE